MVFLLTILKNGKFFIEKGNFKEAILIENGLVKEFLRDEDICKVKADRVIDLEGKTVLPGLNDSHLHMVMMGEAMNSCELSSARSTDDIIRLGREFLEDNPHTRVLNGRGWNQDFFKDGEKRLLNKFDLDQISTDIPIVFSRVCGHVASGNTKALEFLGVDETTRVDGGVIEIGSDGSPNGVFNENAVALLESVKESKTVEDIQNDYLKACQYALSVGITSVQSCDVLRNNFHESFNAIHDIYESGKTKIRYSHQYNFQDIKDFEDYLQGEFKTGKYDGKFLSKGALKLFKDGSLGARTAYMLEDYKDDPDNQGVNALSDEQFQNLCNLATANNVQVVTHAIGDGAIESVINAYENTMVDGKNPLRHGIVHCQITSREQLERIAKLSIPVMYQPIFLDYDNKIVESRVGADLSSTSYAFNTLYELGAPISMSTDSPVENCNPFPNIYCAVTRKDLDGNPKEGFYPEERMAVEDVIDAYTQGSSYNEFKEDFKGKLSPGYVADLIVLDKDIFSIDPDEIKDIKVLKTMIDGEFVFER